MDLRRIVSSNPWYFVFSALVVDVAYMVFRYLQNRLPPPPPDAPVATLPLQAEALALSTTLPVVVDIEHALTFAPNAVIIEELQLIEQLLHNDLSNMDPVSGQRSRSSSPQINEASDMWNSSASIDLSPLLQPLLFFDIPLDSPYDAQSRSPNNPRAENLSNSPFSIISLSGVPGAVVEADLTFGQQIVNKFNEFRLRNKF